LPQIRRRVVYNLNYIYKDILQCIIFLVPVQEIEKLRGNKVQVAAVYAPKTRAGQLEPSVTTVGTWSVKITAVNKQCQNYIAADTEEV
jgi:hypothetical protein